jgi:uncharacterized SAM-binding protein YcdF (DUF218 family)
MGLKSLATVLVLLVIWLAGLTAFADRVDRYAPVTNPPNADAIVALTGRSDTRIIAAMRLLEARRGARLLVSGVNREATREDIQSVTRGYRGLFECCVDLDYEAETTLGNAQHTAEWVRARGYDSLVVVTSDFHMPRALLELKAALPGVVLRPYAIETDTVDAARWWSTGASARRMILEYSKYLVVLFREMILSIGGGEKSTATAPADAEAAPEAPGTGRLEIETVE